MEKQRNYYKVYRTFNILGIIVLLGCLGFSLNMAFGIIGTQAYEKGYSAGYEKGGLEALYVLDEVANEALKDTNKVQCLDFYVDKDTVHVPVWSKAIKKKNFENFKK